MNKAAPPPSTDAPRRVAMLIYPGVAPLDVAGPLQVFGVSNKMRSAAEVAEGVRGFTRDVLPALAGGHLRPVIDKVYAFDELPQAKAYMESNAHLGKIVIRA